MAIIKMDKMKHRSTTSKKQTEEKKQVVHSDDDSEYETLSEYEDDDEDDEDDEEDDDDDESYVEEDDDEDEDDDDDDDEFDDFIVDDDEEDDGHLRPEVIRRAVANIFPSKYMDKRVRADRKVEELKDSKYSKKDKKDKRPTAIDIDDDDDDDIDDETPPKKLRKGQKSTNRYNTRSGNNKKTSSSKPQISPRNKKPVTKKTKKHAEMSSEDEDDSDYNAEDADESPDDANPNINIIFGFGPGGQAADEEEMEDEHALLDEEECDSDDEKMFMKETYQSIELPVQFTEDTKKKNKRSAQHKASRSFRTKPEEKETVDSVTKSKFDTEYTELIEMKKYLAEKMKKNPQSKMWLKSLKECNQSIKKLIKKERGKNTKEYHKMIHGQNRNFTSEIDYFKKKLSNQEQLRVMKDLKEINQHLQIDKPYRLSLLEAKIPAKYKATVLQKLNILRTMEPGDPEYYKMRNWIDTFMRIPIGIYKSLSVNITDGKERCQDFMENAIRTLDNCVYGLNDAKMQIVQMVGQWMTNPASMGTAIAIHGPPGTGKTSLTKDGISKILGREFAFIALGGAGDSSFLEGHSYTYEGSSWGKIIQILIDSKCMNPVIYFDELDKLSDSPRGVEIASILTHLTDTSQNSEFHDKYFSEMSFDLSKCLFIFSYNDESKVNPILKDRMYRIQTKGYNTKEKITIAKNYMLPKIREQVNFEDGMIIIPDDTLEYIITKPSFTKQEDGVRNLKRCLEIIHTKLNLFRLIKPDNEMFANEIKLKVEFPFTVTRKDADLLIKEDEPYNQSMLAMYV